MIWKKLEVNFNNKAFDLAAVWCQLALIPVLKDADPATIAMLGR